MYISLSGVDTILQKTQEDLGRIKKTSYFQRKQKPETPTPVEENKSIAAAVSGSNNSASAEPAAPKPKWIGFEEGARSLQDDEEAAANQVTSPTAVQPPAPVEEEPSTPQLEDTIEELERQLEEEDDIFNTEYTDVVTSGELKLAFVPDSPTHDAADGDDPFDTSVVEKLVGPLPVIKKKKALVSIGAAVEILTAANAADQLQKQQHQASATSRQRIVQPPTEIQLLCCFDGDDTEQKSGGSLAVTPSANRASSLQPTPQTETQPEATEAAVSGTSDLKDILAEFDVIPEDVVQTVVEDLIERPKPAPPAEPVKPELVDEEDFEFEALAYESLAKNLPPVLVDEEEDGDDPFDTSSVDKVLNKPPAVEATASVKKQPPARPTAPVSRPPTRPKAPPSAAAIAAIAAAIDRPPAAPVGAPVPVNPPPAAAPVPPLQAQDSFDALFLNDSPTSERVVPTQQLGEDVSRASATDVDPFDTSAVPTFPGANTAAPLDTPANDPFDTSAVDPFDTSAVDPFDTSVVASLQSAAVAPSSTPAAVDPFDTTIAVPVDSAPGEDPFDTSAIDPFDTSAVVDNSAVVCPSSALPVEAQVQVNASAFAIVPDSPIEDDIDPFDTSAVEKVLN